MHYLRMLLIPLSFVYALVVYLRNRMYDFGILKSYLGALPTVAIGNLATGGTGKTPFTEFLLRSIPEEHSPAVLSRGYLRKTKGFVLADNDATAATLGDEPFQIHQHFRNVPLAVCEDRIEGIKQIQSGTSAGFVILDDALQHRRLLPDFSILLTTYKNPFWRDLPLPAGNLRDNIMEKRRANAIVVTKCPASLDSGEKNRIKQHISPIDSQKIYFSSFDYGHPYRINGPESGTSGPICGFAGLADTTEFESFLNKNYQLRFFKKFADHHNFSPNEILKLWNECGNFASALMTTEKDAVKLIQHEMIQHVPIYVLPIQMYLHDGKEQLVDDILAAIQRKY